MKWESIKDTQNIENEMRWEERSVPKSIFSLLSATADRFKNNNAISFQLLSGPNDKAETLTWYDVMFKSSQTANMFRSLGIGSDDVVACILPNCNETALSILGGMIAGIVNPINPLLEPEQMGAILRETNARVLVTLKSFPKTDVAQKAAQAVSLAPNIQTILEVDLNRYLSIPKKWLVPLLRPKNDIKHEAKVLDFNEVLSRQNATLNFEDIKSDRVVALFHTGGTTGMPKIAQHRVSGIMYNVWVVNTLLVNEGDNLMCPLPMFHVFACHVILMPAILSGAHVIFPTPAGYRGDGVFDNFWKLVERWKITFIITVPTAIAALMQRPVDADISTVKKAYSGSAPIPVELFKRFENSAEIDLVEGYGLTEATVSVASNPLQGHKKIGSVGLRLPYTAIKLIKATETGFEECEKGEIGEICISSPGVWPLNTYTDTSKNSEIFYEEKFLRTGDLGRLDDDEYLWITGRAKDLIIRSGHNIDPAMIEETLLSHEAVAFAGAIGQPDPKTGEMPCVYVELIGDATVTAEELKSFCEENVPERAAHPKYLELLDELPKTAVGKVFKPDLRKRAIKRVFNETLQEAGLETRVETVFDDKKRGMVVELTSGDSDELLQGLLGQFVQPWERK